MALAWTGFQGLILLLRGPHSPRTQWIGWSGGWKVRKPRAAPPVPAMDVKKRGSTEAATVSGEVGEKAV